MKGTADPVYLGLMDKYCDLAELPGVLGKKSAYALRADFTKLKRIRPAKRGVLFEAFLTDLFTAANLLPHDPFQIRGEQIDGSFELQTNTYLVEAKWTKDKVGQNELAALRVRVEGKAEWTRGLYVSMSGFTLEGLDALRNGKATNLICLDGSDLNSILDGNYDLAEVIRRKLRHAGNTNEAFASIDRLFPSEVTPAV